MATIRPRRGRGEDTKPLTSATDYDDEDEEPKSKTDQWLQYAMNKLQALLWIIIAGALAVWTELFHVVVDGHPINKPERQLNRCVLRQRHASQQRPHASKPVASACLCVLPCEV